ncbi:MAG: aldo/keto reductase [Streptococcaceae bacterium]|nr:aldo/keto reductase [Streptococcaceae bacterium]
MEYAKLGNTDIEVSKLSVGCMSFGDGGSRGSWMLNKEDSEKMVQKALELGYNFFDTANIYAGGTSEEFLGHAIKNNIARDKVVVASKVFFNQGSMETGIGNLSKANIEREIEGTLKRLGTDYLDLYIIHRFDASTPIEETMEALHGLVKAGKVRALGASAMFGYQFHNMQVVAEQNGWTKFESMQNHYNLVYREDERELIPVTKQYGVSLTPYSPLAAGRLARAWDKETARSKTDKFASFKYDTTEDTDRRIADRVKELADKHNATMSHIALAWQHAKGVTSPIIGATKPQYLEDAVGAFNVKLSSQDLSYLEELYVPHNIVGALT